MKYLEGELLVKNGGMGWDGERGEKGNKNIKRCIKNQFNIRLDSLSLSKISIDQVETLKIQQMQSFLQQNSNTSHLLGF